MLGGPFRFMGESFPLRVGITTHSPYRESTYLAASPELRPVANGGSFFECAVLAQKAGADSFAPRSSSLGARGSLIDALFGKCRLNWVVG
jgi:hypothetical protein